MPRLQSRAAESQKEGSAYLLNFIASQLNFIATHLKVIGKSFELGCNSCFHLLAFYCLLFTFFSAEDVLGTTEAVSTELLAEAV